MIRFPEAYFRFFITGLISFCLLSFLLPSRIYAFSARECVEDMARAIDEADLAGFSRRVDVDTLVGHALDLFLLEATRPELAREIPPLLAVALAQAARDDSLGQSIRALLFTEARGFLLNGVSSGAFAGRKVSGGMREGVLAPLFAQASMGRKEIVQIGAEEKTSDGWIVPFTIQDHGNGLAYPVKALVTDASGEFRLVRITNLAEIFARIREEARQLEE